MPSPIDGADKPDRLLCELNRRENDCNIDSELRHQCVLDQKIPPPFAIKMKRCAGSSHYCTQLPISLGLQVVNSVETNFA